MFEVKKNETKKIQKKRTEAFGAEKLKLGRKRGTHQCFYSALEKRASVLSFSLSFFENRYLSLSLLCFSLLLLRAFRRAL